MVSLSADNNFHSSPLFVTDSATIAALPPLYRLVADEYIEKGMILIEDDEKGGEC